VFGPPGYEINLLYICALAALALGGLGCCPWTGGSGREENQPTRSDATASMASMMTNARSVVPVGPDRTFRGPDAS